MDRRFVLLTAARAAIVLVGTPHAAFAQIAPAAAARARQLFNDYWEWWLHEYPDIATRIGDRRYDDRLRDESAAAVLRRNAALAAFRERAGQIDERSLERQDRISLRVLRHRLESAIAVAKAYRGLPFGVFESPAPITQISGLHLDLPELANSMRFESVRDYEAWLKRLDAVPDTLSNLMLRMRLAMETGWVPPRAAVSGVPRQLDAHIVGEPRDSPLFAPFKSFPSTIGADERERLAQAAERVLRDRVVPAFGSLKTFYETRYLDAATTQRIGASELPGGPAFYQALLDWSTTTDLDARRIHDIGVSEVARIDAQMDALIGATGFRGTRDEFRSFLTTDPQFFFKSAEEMLAAYRDIAKRADAALPRLFAELPRLPYGVRAMRPEEGNNSEHYSRGAADGSRPGWFEANVNDLRTRPRWRMEALLLHEAVPGHHLQTARAAERSELPAFRRNLWFVAYGEGWALYAESLGEEMGFYTDPYQRFGRLSLEMMRACRLVVDTGLHAFGWTRERAIDYMVEHTAQPRDQMVAEVDRYLAWPGQATAYKIGELKIKALRAMAEAALGERFDLRRFHNAVIDGGALPLAVLEQEIDEWVAEQKAR